MMVDYSNYQVVTEGGWVCLKIYFITTLNRPRARYLINAHLVAGVYGNKYTGSGYAYRTVSGLGAKNLNFKGSKKKKTHRLQIFAYRS